LRVEEAAGANNKFQRNKENEVAGSEPGGWKSDDGFRDPAGDRPVADRAGIYA